METSPSMTEEKQNCSKCGSEIQYLEDCLTPVKCSSCNLLQIRSFNQDDLHFEKLMATSPLFYIYRGYHTKQKLFLEIIVLRQDIEEYDWTLEVVKELGQELTTLSHVNICPLFSYGMINDCFFVSSPRMDGYKLSNYDPESHGLMDISRMVEVLQAAALGLAVAHYKDFSHHNVCPENINIDARGMVRVNNFFLSRFIYAYDQRRMKLDNKIYISVSPHYISPEKAESGVEDHRGDIFSFGVMMYYLMTGEYPFQGKRKTDTIYSRIKKTKPQEGKEVFNADDETTDYISPVTPKERRSEIPEELSQLIMSMLAYYPNNRPALTEVISVFNMLRAKIEAVKIRSIQEQIVDTETRDIPKMEKPDNFN